MAIRRGLTLGKFAPLHAGHQLLIETALAETDELIVMIYDCPETTPVPLPVRANWIRSLYPGAEVLEAWDGPVEVGDTPEIRKRHEDYILARLSGRPITHFYSSEFYGDHVSRALGALNRMVDPARSVAPVSASQIRSAPYEHRKFIHPRVYSDLVANVVLLGAPSTGKTTIARRLADQYATVWMPEYGREYWEKNQVNRRLMPEQLVEIAERHLAREKTLLYEANRFLFTDTNALTTYLFSLYYHGFAAGRLEELARQTAARYDLVFLCDADIPYDDTPDRSGEVNRTVFQKQHVAELLLRKIPFFTLRGDLESRVRQAAAVLNRFQKFTNVLSLRWQWSTG